MATYDYSKSSVQPSRLASEIVAAGLPTTTSITHNEGETPYDLHISFASDLDSGQQSTLATTVTNHDGSAGSVTFPVERSYIEGAHATWTSASQVTIGKSGKISVLDDDSGNGRFAWTGTLTAAITSSGAGGLDTGSEAADTWYAVWAIADSTALNSVSVLLSTSFTSPTLPSGYDLKRLIWAVRNNTSSDFINFMQSGTGATRTCWWVEDSSNVRPLVNSSDTTWTTVDCSAYMPPQTEVGILQINYETGTGGSANDGCDVRADGSAGSPISIHPGFKGSVKSFYQVLCPVSEDQAIEYKVDDAANQATIIVVGWVMDL